MREPGVDSGYSRRLIEASLDPLVTISPAGLITDVNAATETITGRTRSELIGTDFSTTSRPRRTPAKATSRCSGTARSWTTRWNWRTHPAA
ncbi:MAG: PAS domain-containing protein [Actinomycetes bacterium]